MNTKKKNLQENKYPLSEETYLKLRNLTPQENNKLPIELLMKYAKNGRDEARGERIIGLGVDPDSVSKVVDENGEPLVVSKSRKAYILL